MLRLPRSGRWAVFSGSAAARHAPRLRVRCLLGVFPYFLAPRGAPGPMCTSPPPRPLYPATSPRSCGDFDRRKVLKNEDPRTGGARRCWAVAARGRRRWSTRRVWHPGASTRTSSGDPLLYPKRTHRFLRFPALTQGRLGRCGLRPAAHTLSHPSAGVWRPQNC